MPNRECARCGEVKDESKFQRSFGTAYKNTCKACYARRERARLKLAMFDALGQQCSCCGEVHPDLLSLDHVQNDGARWREKYNEQQMYRMAIRENWPKDKYQVLCMNCNFAKGHFGQCPHQSGRTAEQRMWELRELAKVHRKFRNFNK